MVHAYSGLPRALHGVIKWRFLVFRNWLHASDYHLHVQIELEKRHFLDRSTFLTVAHMWHKAESVGTPSEDRSHYSVVTDLKRQAC